MSNNVYTECQDLLSQEVAKFKRLHNNPIQAFTILKQNNFSKCELMIVDSVWKGFNITGLPNLLLIIEDRFYEIVSETVTKLQKLNSVQTYHNHKSLINMIIQLAHFLRQMFITYK